MAYIPRSYRRFLATSATLKTCVMCGKEIDISKENGFGVDYLNGESLGEYWCKDCVTKENENVED